MKPRLARPVLAALVGGALLAGSAVFGSPAHASPDGSSVDAPTENLTADPLPTGPEQTVAELKSPVTEMSSAVTEPEPPVSQPVPPVVAEPEPPVTQPAPPPADTTRPTGSFRLNHTAVWNGQQITLGQSATEFGDPVDAPATLKRVVSWGDGTTTELGPNTFSATKAYARAGNFAVTVTVTDPTGNQSAIPSRTVAVTVPAGRVSLGKKAVYQAALFPVTVTKVPAGATSMRIDWSDGSVSTHKAKTGTVHGYIHYQWKWDAATKRWVRVGTSRISGNRVIKIAWGNAKGYAANQNAGTINIVKDSWKPGLTISKPSPANRASSWRTIRGTVSDKGSGLRHVGVTMVRVTTGGKMYCLMPNRKWKQVRDENGIRQYCYRNGGVKVKAVKGKWSLKVPAGVGKGQIWAEAWAYDWADNYRFVYRTAKITR